MEYLEDQFPNPPFRSVSAKGRAQQRAIVSFVDFSIAPKIVPLLQALIKKSEISNVEIKELQGVLSSLEELFVRHECSPSEELDWVDCSLLPSLFYAVWICEKQGLEDLFANLPQLKEWWTQKGQIPAVQKVFKEIEAGLLVFLRRFS